MILPGACLLAVRLAAASGATVYGGDRLPLLALGGALEVSDGRDTLERTVRFGAPGVWYLWFQATTGGPAPALLTWDLDGVQPLHSGRAQILVQPYAARQWVSCTRQPLQHAMVHVEAPGEHVLRIRALQGRVVIDRIALTLFFSATPAGDTLDHARDPGAGRAVFPVGDWAADGFRDDAVFPPVRAARTFHVDADRGDDARSGLRPDRAWRSLRRVEAERLRPGDAVLLKRGGRWEGGVAPAGDGTLTRPVTLGAYGEGPRPVIDGIHRDAVALRDASHWVVRDLALTSDPAYGRCGLQAQATRKGRRPSDLRVFNVVAFDNGGPGINIAFAGEGDGYDGVLVENCLAFCNGGEGINIYGRNRRGCRNAVIRRCTAYENRGSPGAGLMISAGENGLIERSRAYNNVSINIWTWNARNITIRRCEAFRGHESDAGGFDLDYGTEACTIEYCYAHHDEGPGFLLMGSGRATDEGFASQSRYDLLRYCVTEDDASPIPVDQTFEHGLVHNNLSIVRGRGRAALGFAGHPLKPGDATSGGWPADTFAFNNIVIGREGAGGAHVDDYAATQGNRLDYNLYFVPDGLAPVARWGGRMNGSNFWTGEGTDDSKPATACATLDSFRSVSGQEAHGVQGDPGFASVGAGAYGRLPLAAYSLSAASPAAHAGCPPALPAEWLRERAKLLADTGAEGWGIPMAPGSVTEDWRGTRIDPARPASIGPFEP
jgi:hypothetical protein